MMVAYSFWMVNTQDFDFENFEKSYIESKVDHDFGVVSGFKEDYSDIESMIQHMELARIVRSGNLPEMMKVLDDKYGVSKGEMMGGRESETV